MMSDRPKQGIELNTVQLVASMGAAVTGAVLTSYLGDGGTILGTAVGSGASTAGFAVYKHYLARTKEKVTPVIVEHARQWTPTGTMTDDEHSAGSHSNDGSRAGGNGDVTRADVTRADWEQARRTAPGWAEPTRAEPGWGPGPTRQDLNRNDLGQTRQDYGQTRQDFPPTRQDFGQPRFIPHQAAGPDADATRTTGYDPAGYEATRYGTVRMGDGTLVNGSPAGPGGPGSSGPDRSGGSGGGEGRHGKSGGGLAGFLANRPGWFVPAATAAAVFVVALIIITVVELGTGKPIDASVWGRSQTGTTLGGSHSKATTTPTTNATPTQSATPSVGATGGQSTGAGTTGPTTGPTPTPSSVPTVGSTGGATVPASGAPGGQNGAGNGAGNGNASIAPGQ
jgi:hypothetical protein